MVKEREIKKREGNPSGLSSQISNSINYYSGLTVMLDLTIEASENEVLNL